MGRTVISTETAEYEERVKRNVESAVQTAGFGGWVCQSGPLTVGCIARISSVLQTPPEAWFPEGELSATAEAVRGAGERSASARTDRHPGMHKFELAPRAQFLLGR